MNRGRHVPANRLPRVQPVRQVAVRRMTRLAGQRLYLRPLVLLLMLGLLVAGVPDWSAHEAGATPSLPTFSKMPSQRRGFVIVSGDAAIYALGGVNPQNQYISAIEQ